MRMPHQTWHDSSRASARLRRPWLLAFAAVIAVVVVAILVAASRSKESDEVGVPAAETAAAKTLTLPEIKGDAYYVAPNGSQTANGTKEHPLDLATALSSNSPAAPGDTIWLRGGTYEGHFVSELRGATTMPILVRQY